MAVSWDRIHWDKDVVLGSAMSVPHTTYRQNVDTTRKNTLVPHTLLFVNQLHLIPRNSQQVWLLYKIMHTRKYWYSRAERFACSILLRFNQIRLQQHSGIPQNLTKQVHLPIHAQDVTDINSTYGSSEHHLHYFYLLPIKPIITLSFHFLKLLHIFWR